MSQHPPVPLGTFPTPVEPAPGWPPRSGWDRTTCG